MKQHLSRIIRWAIIYIFILSGVLLHTNYVSAVGSGLTVSPMNQSIVLTPGESYDATFTISNPSNSSDDTYYELSISPFYLNDKSEAIFDVVGDSNKITEWITILSPTNGKLAPNEKKDIEFHIEVPTTAPAGGQYASIIATMKKGNLNNNQDGKTDIDPQTTIEEIQRISHLVYAEITGNTIKQGKIIDANVSSFLLNGNIKGTSSIKNTGNVHGIAKYTLRVFPLFSDEEIYTNEEDPAIMIIFPDRTVYNETSWDETPTIGIFNVIYTVDFENATTEIKKLVIKCPIWLLFIIIFAIFALIFYFIAKSKARKKASQKANKN